MRGLVRDLAFGFRSLAEEPRGVALVAVGGVLAGALSLAIWTHIDRVVLGSVEPIEVGALYAVAAPSGVPARAVFWSEPVSSVTGACRVHASPAASHIDDRNFLLQQLNWHPRATPAPPPPPDDDQSEDEPAELSPCQLDACTPHPLPVTPLVAR